MSRFQWSLQLLLEGLHKRLLLEAEWANIPPAVFPHRSHVAWLDCNN